MSIDPHAAAASFHERFGPPHEYAVRAPGRVNLIGEHTDYNHGFVLPIAIDRDTVILARRRPGRRWRVHSGNLGRDAEIDLENPTRNIAEPWADYVSGVLKGILDRSLPVFGADVLVVSDVPLGRGLSSSAALEMAVLKLAEVMGGFQFGDAEAAQLGQQAEAAFLGVHCGIMDQFVSRAARAGHAVFLDCRSLEAEVIPASFKDALFVVADTGVRRELSASRYNERVHECAEAVLEMFERLGKPGTHLRDFTLADLEIVRANLSASVYRRARHVMTENLRTCRARDTLIAGNAPAFGRLMIESDESLRADYEVTCPELDIMTAIACSLTGCHGARMTGAGFGGCTVHLVARSHAHRFIQELAAAYAARCGRLPEIFMTEAAPGAEQLTT